MDSPFDLLWARWSRYAHTIARNRWRKCHARVRGLLARNEVDACAMEAVWALSLDMPFERINRPIIARQVSNRFTRMLTEMRLLHESKKGGRHFVVHERGAGQIFFQRLICNRPQPGRNLADADQLRHRLRYCSPRGRQVALARLAGKTQREIAAEIGMSENGVIWHIRNLRRQLASEMAAEKSRSK